MRNIISQGLVVFAGVTNIPASLTHQSPTRSAEYRKADPRLDSLRRFFRSGDCPAGRFSEIFLQEADRNRLDWRLLPSISMVESSGGKHSRRNNIFGWRNGRAQFSSVSAGIHEVAYTLSHSRIYRNKDVDGVLRTYNPYGGYPEKVKSVMQQISFAVN